MKKLLTTLFVLQAFLLLSFAPAGNELTKEERATAEKVLLSSQETLLNAVKGLSEDQLNFKPSEDAWSIAECVEHIAISESNIFGILEMTLKEEPNPERRAEIKMTDEQILNMIADRTNKVKTSPEFEPVKKFGSFEGSLKEFETKRVSNIEFIKTTTEDLRNRYFEFPFGLVDSYQIIMFMAGHNNRHTKQIEEIKANAGFPKK